MASAASVSGAPARRPACSKRLAQVVDLVPLGAIAHAELKSEIDTEADEQHRKIDRDQIERADHQHAERGRDRKARRQGRRRPRK